VRDEILINIGLQPGAIAKQKKPFQRFYLKEKPLKRLARGAQYHPAEAGC
jgi:hypothetical protein